ncbi:UDP-N-acetylenolpyruvoylglucosamine reductase [Prosthecochloris sp. GSB1]|uniref:UDP-N-acetylmuramate dehydrogenase n=1 Tax=Prosthecochloris sp. GSB1 TaxID=281093 RepID=UPI000B8CCA32|nr:UDP-N-acetylmuramate dehydrogenase [Prosthecochloris sp. GSB1]ASQ91498.1 UDP-N-acetylenolpyruvoylglucosamine reductase [Prosthecochloris sp. GSB1]
MISTEELLAAVKGTVLLGEPMKDHTTLRIGGSADFFIDPLDREDFCRAYSFFRKHGLPCTVIGRGSNILVHDEGIRGAVIVTTRALGEFSLSRGLLTVGAGFPLPAAAEKTFAHSLGGLEMLQGIPGTIGGALVMNAGAYGQEIGSVVSWVEVFGNGKPKTLCREDLFFGYRQSSLAGSVILRASMRLERLPAAETGKRSVLRDEAFAKRRLSQPFDRPNAGSVFRNPSRQDDPEGLGAGRMIEACGLKGLRYGGAVISNKHANFIVNEGDAKASDVLELIATARERVKEKFGVLLELEVRLLGCENVCC